jgi:uncharacterized membrane protein YgdD (TMEM256/DUF423 family)
MIATERLYVSTGGLAALAGVALGAFGAHALKGRLSAEMIAVWRTAVEYHLFHSLGLIAIGLVAARLPRSGLLKWSAGLMLSGIFLFSGSLYALALSGERWWGAVTPLGGVAFLSAWALFVAAAASR